LRVIKKENIAPDLPLGSYSTAPGHERDVHSAYVNLVMAWEHRSSFIVIIIIIVVIIIIIIIVIGISLFRFLFLLQILSFLF